MKFESMLISVCFLLCFSLSLSLNANKLDSLLLRKHQSNNLKGINKFIKNLLYEEETNLQARGEGITADQETFLTNLINQAERIYSDDQYSTALFLQDKVESAWGGRWNVEIFGEDPSWGRATHIENDKWVLLFGYGSYSWDFIIWKPLC